MTERRPMIYHRILKSDLVGKEILDQIYEKLFQRLEREQGAKKSSLKISLPQGGRQSDPEDTVSFVINENVKNDVLVEWMEEPEEVSRDEEVIRCPFEKEMETLLPDELHQNGLINDWQWQQLKESRFRFTLGKYRIIDSLGVGGYGQVFLARPKSDPSNTGLSESKGKRKNDVAIKVLPLHQTNSETVSRFQKEIQISGSINHQNVVSFINYSHDASVYYVVYEYMDGFDLKRLINTYGKLPPTMAAYITVEIAKALQYLHQQRRVIHRDIKPANILFSQQGQVKLIDFGLAIDLQERKPATPSDGFLNDEPSDRGQRSTDSENRLRLRESSESALATSGALDESLLTSSEKLPQDSVFFTNAPDNLLAAHQQDNQPSNSFQSDEDSINRFSEFFDGIFQPKKAGEDFDLGVGPQNTQMSKMSDVSKLSGEPNPSTENIESDIEKENARCIKVAGTPDYISPDQIRHPEEPSPSWDIYSLGCTLYYMVTGIVPFPSGDVRQKLQAQLRSDPPDPKMFNPLLDQEMIRCIRDMMDKNPETRISSATEIIQRLKPWYPTFPKMNKILLEMAQVKFWTPEYFSTLVFEMNQAKVKKFFGKQRKTYDELFPESKSSSFNDVTDTEFLRRVDPADPFSIKAAADDDAKTNANFDVKTDEFSAAFSSDSSSCSSSGFSSNSSSDIPSSVLTDPFGSDSGGSSTEMSGADVLEKSGVLEKKEKNGRKSSSTASLSPRPFSSSAVKTKGTVPRVLSEPAANGELLPNEDLLRFERNNQLLVSWLLFPLLGIMFLLLIIFLLRWIL